MLQCLSSILDEKAQIHLWEKGDEEPIQRHPNFHLFAAMNPSTDVGKKDLPIGIRNRLALQPEIKYSLFLTGTDMGLLK